MSKRTLYPSGAIWEDIVGYSRAVKCGNVIEISGTTAFVNGNIEGKGDYYIQTKTILEKISGILKKAGSSLEAVTRTRIYVRDISKWDEVARAHLEFFQNIRPATSMVEITALIDPELLVEIEATAVV